MVIMSYARDLNLTRNLKSEKGLFITSHMQFGNTKQHNKINITYCFQ